MKKYTLIIDPGHGGHDPGAVSPHNGLKEKNVVLDVAFQLQDHLKGIPGLTVLFTRQTDSFISLADRVKKANAHPSAFTSFISIHCNSAESREAHGFEIFTSKGRTSSDALATSIFNSWDADDLSKTMRSDLEDGDPDKEAGFYVLRNTNCPATLVELGFVTNKREVLNLQNISWRRSAAMAIGDGFLDWAYETGRLDELTPNPNPNPTIFTTNPDVQFPDFSQVHGKERLALAMKYLEAAGELIELSK